MIPANCIKVTCPHCGDKKELFQLRSGNTCHAKQWSDAKQIAPMLPQLSPVQKCPMCGHYYLLSRISKDAISQGDSYSNELGWLSFSEGLQAITEIESPTEHELSTLNIVAIWGYNDIIRSGKEPNETQKNEFITFVASVLKNKTFADNVILSGELNREIGNFDECISILSGYKDDNEYINDIVRAILNKARNRDSKVFVL